MEILPQIELQMLIWKTFSFSSKRRAMFHHHDYNYTGREGSTAFKSSPYPTYGHMCPQDQQDPRAARKNKDTTVPMERGHMDTEWPSRPSCPFSDHILFPSPPRQGAGSALGQEAVSQRSSTLGFSGNELGVSDEHPGRAETVPDFPPHPLLVPALIGEQPLLSPVPAGSVLRSHRQASIRTLSSTSYCPCDMSSWPWTKTGGL